MAERGARPESKSADEVEPAESIEPAEVAAASVDPVETPAETTATAAKVVFVETPVPPKRRGNRGVGAALALLGTVVFALVLALAVFVYIAVSAASEFASAAFASYVGSAAFWVPILFFTLGFVLVVLLLNRAGWWAHILGSVVVALVTYFGSIGVLLLLDNVVLMTPTEAGAAFTALLVQPPLVIAALVARETAIWVGLAIAARGRRVTVRNLERRAAFDRELAEKKAEHERAAAEG